MNRPLLTRWAFSLAPLAAVALLACSSNSSGSADTAGSAAGGNTGLGSHSSGAGMGGAIAPGGSSNGGSANGSAGGNSSSGGATAGGASGGEPPGGNGNGASASGGTGQAGQDSGGSGGRGGASSNGGSGGQASHWIPSVNTTFYWDLSNAPPDNGKNVGAYDIDGWNNTAAEVSTLHQAGMKVVCYMDAGTYEPGRPDSANFPASLKGKAVSGWPGEFWLDVRPSGPNYAALQAIMLARFKECQAKGFDAVEPDNLDSYQNKPGFTTTAADQLAYNEWIAVTVHSLGLAVFQKNDLDQVDALEPYFDGILDEECNKYSECSTLAPYTAASKPVWDAEYTEDGESTASFCAADVKAGIVGALFALDLDGSLFEPCSNDVGNVH